MAVLEFLLGFGLVMLLVIVAYFSFRAGKFIADKKHGR